jgi:hypothetical protein
MGHATSHSPALLLLCAFSRHPAALEWSRRRATEAWGPIAVASEPFDFEETTYYEPTMGPGLKKVFWAFERPFDPARLAEIKLLTNAWESEFAAAAREGTLESPEAISVRRPLNIDPGYLTVAKLVLASTKDHTHRIYLRDGIYAEITLFYRHGQWEHHEWTFRDYRRADYQAFFTCCRDWLKSHLSVI